MDTLFCEYDANIDYDFISKKKVILPYEFCKDSKAIPLAEKNGSILLGITSMNSLSVIQQAKLLLNKDITPVICPDKVVEHWISVCYQKKVALTSQKSLDAPQSIGYDLLAQNSSTPVIKFLDNVLICAIQDGASDIHFIPAEQGIDICFRVDSLLQKRYEPPKEYQSHLITRIKVLSNLDIAENRLPQDGRLKLKMGNREIDFRVSTLPTVFGERLVLRILDKQNICLGMNSIGMPKEIMLPFKKLISRPDGIILVTGPTGSGKTTTLYSALTEINKSFKNIMTIEDPVEYKIANISQINVNPKIGLTFSKGLRHILRQDPDVILVGEIRDKETAKIAIQSALTGHLVFSTLHTNDAPSAIIRMMDMGIESYLLSSAIIGVLAQRLVCAICSFCKENYAPTATELKELGLPKGEYTFSRGKKCEKCFFSGYKGRLAIYELFIVDKALKRMIISQVDLDKLRKTSKMVSLRNQGIKLVLAGKTTVEEVLRISISQE